MIDEKRLAEIERNASLMDQSGVDTWDTIELLAEVKRLRDSTLRWKSRWQDAVDDAGRARCERDEARTIINELHEQCERMKKEG